MGSIMLPSQQIRRPEDVRTKEQLFPLAKEFIDQYFSSIKRQVHVYTGKTGYWVQRLQVQMCRQLNQDLSIRPLPAMHRGQKLVAQGPDLAPRSVFV